MFRRKDRDDPDGPIPYIYSSNFQIALISEYNETYYKTIFYSRK